MTCVMKLDLDRIRERLAIAGTSDAIAISPRLEINRPDMRVAVFEMANGTIRITCADGEQIVTHQPR